MCQTTLNEYQNTIKNRAEDVGKIINDVLFDLNRWELTKEKLANLTESKGMEESLDKGISALQDLMKSAHLRLDKVFTTQKKITELILVIDEEISNIEFAENQRRKDYFVFDSKPIWGKSKKLVMEDGISSETPSSSFLISEGVKQNSVSKFLSFKYKNIYTSTCLSYSINGLSYHCQY
jgi:hypothetical protein